MSNLSKVAIPVVLVFVLYTIYILLPSDEIGSFDKVRASGEINQSVKVYMDHSKGYKQDSNKNIVSFYTKDRNNDFAIVTVKEPASPALMDAKVVELFGHMHQENFVAMHVTIIK